MTAQLMMSEVRNVERLYREGKALYEIAAETHRNVNTVSRILHRLGIKPMRGRRSKLWPGEHQHGARA